MAKLKDNHKHTREAKKPVFQGQKTSVTCLSLRCLFQALILVDYFLPSSQCTPLQVQEGRDYFLVDAAWLDNNRESQDGDTLPQLCFWETLTLLVCNLDPSLPYSRPPCLDGIAHSKT